MSKFHSFWAFFLRHKYIVTISAIIIIVGFLDENSIWNRHKRKAIMNRLQSEIQVNRSEYEKADKQLKALDGNHEALEKIARERYYMRRENEDVFVLVETETSETEDSVQSNSL
jgi:cell division protein FtsB